MKTLPERLREKAGDVEREAADEIERLERVIDRMATDSRRRTWLDNSRDTRGGEYVGEQ